MNHTLLALALLLATSAVAQSFVTWDGGGDGVSFESSANWLQFDTFGPPPDGTFASGNVIGYHEILIFAPVEAIDINQSHKVNLGDGSTLTVSDGLIQLRIPFMVEQETLSQKKRKRPSYSRKHEIRSMTWRIVLA